MEEDEEDEKVSKKDLKILHTFRPPTQVFSLIWLIRPLLRTTWACTDHA